MSTQSLKHAHKSLFPFYRAMRVVFLAALLSIADTSVTLAFTTVRDAETERLLRSIGNPIFEAAELNPKFVKLHIQATLTINAFATEKQDIILTTGILEELPDVDMVAAVIAHETAHIAGKHPARTRNSYDKLSRPVLLTALLGIGAAIAGAPAAGGALFAAGTTIGQRSALTYSREQEAAADQAAVTFLDKAGQTPQGFASLFTLLSKLDSAAASGKVNIYKRTHPLSRDRVLLLEDRIKNSPHVNKKPPTSIQHAYDMVRAKLSGYTNKPEVTYRRYPEKDQSSPALYARTFAAYKESRIKKSLKAIEELIAREPNNPWFYETKGQILFENGHVQEALEPYQKAVDLQPDESLLEYALGQVMLATGDNTLVSPAIDYLENSIHGEPDFTPAYFQLAMGYGRKGQIGQAELATAERYIREGDISAARHHAISAQEKLSPGTPQWLRASDILARTNTIRGKG